MTALEEETPAPGGALGSEGHTDEAGDTEHSAPRVDLEDARKFLAILDPNAGRFHFRTFDDRGRGSGKNYVGTLDEVAVDLQLDNGNGRGVFVVVNEGGHKADEIHRVRALFADFDNGSALKLARGALASVGEPHVVVQSSQGNIHAYWLVDGLAPGEFKPMQQAIAQRFGSDPSVCDLPRVMRLPGFLHQKRAATRVKVIHESGAAPFAAAELRARLAADSRRAEAMTPLTPGTACKVVNEGRHDDMRLLAAKLGRQVAFEGLRPESALALMEAEGASGRWTREVPRGEMQRALNGAVEKCRTGEWRPPPATTTPEAGNRRTLAFRRASELIANPRPLAWLIRGILELDSLAQIFADPGVGKTFVALDMGFSVALGPEWHGRRVSTGPVFYIAGEGGNGLGRRLRALELARGREIGDAPFFLSSVPASLTDAEGAVDALAAVDALVHEHGKPSLIVLDTVARNFGGGDENSTRDMSAFIAACDRIRETTGACVLLVHHSGHGDKSRARGSTALKGALDWEYSLSKDAGTLQLECTKAKDAEPPPPMSFRLTPVDLGIVDEDGEPITSAALSPALYMRPSSAGKAGRGKNQTAALRVLRELLQVERARLDQIGGDTDNATVPLAAWREGCAAEGIKANRFAELVKTLQAAGLATVHHDRVSDHDSRDFAPE